MPKPELGFSELPKDDKAQAAFEQFNAALRQPAELYRAIAAMAIGEEVIAEQAPLVSVVETVLNSTDYGARLDFRRDADRTWGEIFSSPEHQEASYAYTQADTLLRQALIARKQLEESGENNDAATIEMLRLTTEIQQLEIEARGLKRLRGLRALGAVAQLHLPPPDKQLISDKRVLASA